MSKTRKAIPILIVAILLASSVGTTAFYFNRIVEDKNSKISSLESQVENARGLPHRAKPLSIFLQVVGGAFVFS